MMFPQQLLDEIRGRLSIVTVVGEHVPLKKAGRNFKGHCPFHQEKTASFMVNEEKQIYHCFGCGDGGDIFTFLMKIDGLSFVETVKELAGKCGVKLPTPDKGSTPEKDADLSRRRQWGTRLNQITMEFFSENLWGKNGARAREYLKKRGLSESFAREHQLGYALDDWSVLAGHFKEKNVPLPLALDLGLIKQREKGDGYYDFFRDRLIFPIFSHRGECVGFGGRTLGDDPAKYLNSSDSILYSKTRQVYGLNWAKEEVREKDRAIFVEGYIDLLSLRQVGIKNVVAPLGTALTLEQIQLLRRWTPNFFLAFDGDGAGQQAAFRTLPLFFSLSLVPRAIVMPKGEDPDTLIRKSGAKGWEELEKTAPELFVFFLATLVRGLPKDTASKMQTWETIKPILETIQDPILGGVYRRRVSEVLGFEEAWLLADLAKKHQKNTRASPKSSKKEEGLAEEERWLIAALIFKTENLKSIDLSTLEDVISPESLKIVKEIVDQSLKGHPITVGELPSEWNQALVPYLRGLSLVEEETDWGRITRDCLKKIRTRAITKQLLVLNRAIQEAEKAGDEDKLLQLLGEKKFLMQKEVEHGRQ